MAQRRDEAGSSGAYPVGVPVPDDSEVTAPGEIDEGDERHRDGPGVERNEQLRNVERLPRKGDELDEMGDIPTD